MTNEATTTPFDETTTPAAPEKGATKKTASKKNAAPKGQKTAKPAKKAKAESKAKPAKSPTKKPGKSGPKSPRTETKGAKLLALIARPKGATLAELMKELAWQAHSIRGFISIAGKKGTKITSEKNADGERTYRIAK